jgi:hypothetical protein
LAGPAPACAGLIMLLAQRGASQDDHRTSSSCGAKLPQTGSFVKRQLLYRLPISHDRCGHRKANESTRLHQIPDILTIYNASNSARFHSLPRSGWRSRTFNHLRIFCLLNISSGTSIVHIDAYKSCRSHDESSSHADSIHSTCSEPSAQCLLLMFRRSTSEA